MSDESTDDVRPDGAGIPIDDWLSAAGFVHADIDPVTWVVDDHVDDDELDDPWADVDIALPTLSDAQRRYLLGDDASDTVDATDLAAADAAIIDLPDEDEIEPFRPQ